MTNSGRLFCQAIQSTDRERDHSLSLFRHTLEINKSTHLISSTVFAVTYLISLSYQERKHHTREQHQPASFLPASSSHSHTSSKCASSSSSCFHFSFSSRPNPSHTITLSMPILSVPMPCLSVHRLVLAASPPMATTPAVPLRAVCVVPIAYTVVPSTTNAT